MNYVHPSIKQNMSLNAIIVSEAADYTFKEFQHIILLDFLNQMKNSSIQCFSHAQCQDQFKLFQSKGIIHNDNQYQHIKDFNVHAKVFRPNRLIFDVDGIYLDLARTCKISNNPSASYSEIINVLSIHYPQPKSLPIRFVYNDLFNLSGHMQSGTNNFITPFNKLFIDTIIQKYVPLEYIGIISGDTYYLYITRNNKLIKINKIIAFILELYIKDMLDEYDLHLIFNGDSILQTKTLETFYGLLDL